MFYVVCYLKCPVLLSQDLKEWNLCTVHKSNSFARWLYWQPVEMPATGMILAARLGARPALLQTDNSDSLRTAFDSATGAMQG